MFNYEKQYQDFEKNLKQIRDQLEQARDYWIDLAIDFLTKLQK
jgi:hypothetical protein